MLAAGGTPWLPSKRLAPPRSSSATVQPATSRFRSSPPSRGSASRRRILRAAARAQFWKPREVTHIARTARARRTRLWWSLNKRRARSRLLRPAGARTRAGGSGRRRGTQRSAPPLKSTATRCAAAGASGQRVWWLPTTRGRLLHSATLSITKVAACRRAPAGSASRRWRFVRAAARATWRAAATSLSGWSPTRSAQLLMIDAPSLHRDCTRPPGVGPRVAQSTTARAARHAPSPLAAAAAAPDSRASEGVLRRPHDRRGGKRCRLWWWLCPPDDRRWRLLRSCVCGS